MSICCKNCETLAAIAEERKQELVRYRKALEEIEGIVSKDYYNDTWADISIKLDEILDIINKAKGEGKCQ